MVNTADSPLAFQAFKLSRTCPGIEHLKQSPDTSIAWISVICCEEPDLRFQAVIWMTLAIKMA
jgi:hypothetical protein